LHPDNGGYLGGVQEGRRKFVVFLDDIQGLGLPTRIEHELRAFHEVATGDAGGTGTDYISILQDLDKLDESDFVEWAVGLAARLNDALGDNWTVRLSDRW
jgi:hypothetical protein